MKRNNRGFTMVELIVSIAILGIIAVAVSSFLLAGTRSYTKVNYAVRLQYETQLAMNQIESYVMNGSQGIAWDNKTLYIVNSDKTMTVLKLSGTQILLFSDAKQKEPTIDDKNIFAEHVKDLKIEFTPQASDKPQNATTAKVTLTMESGGRTYTGVQKIALRNKPLVGTSWEKLWAALPADA